MGFRPWGYKMNSPSTGLITEQYSLSLIYYSVYEFFLFFPSGHRFPFFSPLYMNVSKLQNSIATCSATLCNKPALLLSLKWLHWTRVTHCLPSGNLSKCSPRVVSLPIVYQLVAKTPWNWSLHAKTPNQLNHKEITVFFFPSPTMVAILFFLWAISFMLRSASYSDCEDKATPNVSSSLCWCSPCNVINAAPVSSLQLISHAFVIALKPGRKKDYTRKAFRALCQKAKPKTLWISLNTNHFIKS